MFKKAIAAAAVISVFALAGCPFELPELTSPELPELSAKLGDLWPGIPDASTQELPAVPKEGEQPFKLPPDFLGGDAGIPIPVPPGAGDNVKNIVYARIDLDVKNNIPAPIKLQAFLAKEKPFESPPALDLEIQAGGTEPKVSTGSITIDFALLKERELRLGLKLSSPGSGGSAVSISKEAKIAIKSKVAVKLKLF